MNNPISTNQHMEQTKIDKLNTFQLKITDGSGVEGLPPGDNIAFCYKDCSLPYDHQFFY